MFKKLGKDGINKAAIAIIVAALTLLITNDYYFRVAPLDNLNNRIIDESFSTRGIKTVRDKSDIIIIEITRNTHTLIPAPYNSWPFARFIFAKLINNLSEAGVKAIGIDIVMSSSDEVAEFDSLMINAIRQSGKVVVAGKIEETEGVITLKKSDDVSVSLSSPTFQIKRAHEDFGNHYFQADSSIGIVQVIGDNDGVYRRYLPFMYSTSTDRLVPSFGFAILNKFYGYKKDYLASIEPESFLFGAKVIPKYDNVGMLINFYGPDGTFQRIDFIDVIDDINFKTAEEIELDTDTNTWDDPEYGLKFSNIFKDKIVIIGSTQPEDKDILPVAFAKGEKTGDNNMYGVEYHANAIQNIINNDFLYKMPKVYEVIFIFLLSILIFYISSYFKSRKTKYGFLLEFANLVVVFILIFVLRKLSFYSFETHNYIIPIINPTIAILFGYFGNTAYHFFVERKQKTMIRGMFSRYVSSSVVNDIISNPDKLKLGGERKILTVLFSDIAGFSTFSEKKDPAELVSFLNEYLEEMTNIILNTKGTLDKYIGDAIMAFWGAPIEFERHAFYACNSALSMQHKLNELRKRWESEGQTLIDIRIGINTGDMIVGNIGGKEHFDYTVMGDNVNLASRLEGANKEYDTRIMISEATHEIIKDEFYTRELDLIVVKGKTKPSRVFELLGSEDFPLEAQITEALIHYNRGLDKYKQREFGSAIVYFKKVLSFVPSDGPSKIYIQRCKSFLENPPPPDWEGVYIMKTK